MAFGQFHYSNLKPAYGGHAQVNRPVASFLRSYQLNGGFTPGPVLLLCTVLGVLGALLGVVLQVRQVRGSAGAPRAARARQLALACLLFTATAVVLLLAQDLVEFSWRYQLPAVITLPPAGILGLSALLALRRDRAELSPAATVDESADTAKPASAADPASTEKPAGTGEGRPSPGRSRAAPEPCSAVAVLRLSLGRRTPPARG